jgi:hypothetical protein
LTHVVYAQCPRGWMGVKWRRERKLEMDNSGSGGIIRKWQVRHCGGNVIRNSQPIGTDFLWFLGCDWRISPALAIEIIR